ncbi:hypothetical protein IMZ08_10290 [Bacillus luteolus]|uniref:Uncharacterized protein n=1 Tax=Litchfieldia luteola TaxID=682179 RepID=A0ABR9QJU6_9BACI|nr:hypothetical protein [Cytobacillus luteolus]MBE4908444.1 hypothetical protein [Cytobacillus luteolus]MBP1941292.1 hypothetical protein [Cytobacillus luteolus]
MNRDEKRKQLRKQIQAKYRKIKQQKRKETEASDGEIVLVVTILILLIVFNALFKSL